MRPCFYLLRVEGRSEFTGGCTGLEGGIMLFGFRVAVEVLGTVWIDMVFFYGFA
jgi:hypothetical protein